MDKYWTIHGKNYDLRKFIERHPGGQDIILISKGKDCTELFECYHTFTNKHKQILDKYYIKDVPDYKSDFDWDNTPFYDECKAAVKKYFSPKGTESTGEIIRNSKIPWKYAFGYFVGFLLMLYSFYLFCTGDFYAIFHFPLLYYLIGLECMHTGGHNGMCTYPIINKITSYVGFLNCQYYIWYIQHVFEHHQYTNIIDKDFDLNVGKHFKNSNIELPGYRTHKEQIYENRYKRFWKHATLFLFPSFITFGLSLTTFIEYFNLGKMENFKLSEYIKYNILYDRLVTLFCIFTFICCYPHGILKGLFVTIWALNIHGNLFFTFTQISHLNEGSMIEVEKYKKKKDQKKVEWAVHQMLSTMDYAPDSTFLKILSVSLNYQIVHHMFPSVNPAHYPAIRKLLIPIAKKYDIDYEKRSSQTFGEALTNYYNWIYSLNEDPKDKVLCMRKSTLYGMIGTSVMITTTFILPMYYLF
jgi:fatty acid desaturase